MKKIILITVSILILSFFLIVLNLNLERKEGTVTYPFEASLLEKFSANTSQFFKTSSSKRIEVNLTTQRMKLYEGNEEVREFVVSTGKSTTSTPTGNFKIYSKSVMIYSKIASCWLPFWASFTSNGLYGFHEIPICKKGRKGLDELGKPVSMGCIRLGLNDSEEFYKWINIGTTVRIYGQEQSEEEKEVKMPPEKEGEWCYNFTTNMSQGQSGTRIKNLHLALENEEILESSDGEYFGSKTREAVIVFQERYASEVLSPWNLIKGTGFVGPTTRAKLNQLYNCQ